MDLEAEWYESKLVKFNKFLSMPIEFFENENLKLFKKRRRLDVD